jgi:hypothetical protein
MGRGLNRPPSPRDQDGADATEPAMFAAFLHVLPYVLGGALCLFLLCGFWRGLSLRPHEREHRPPPLSRYFWWAND